jgi:LMBR1 domain-containing protein 1
LFRKLKAGVEILDRQYRMLLIQNNLNDKWVCQYWLLLFIGIITFIITLAWIAQILCMFVIIPDNKPIYPLINNLLLYFQDHGVSFLSYLFFGLFCLYLLWATVKGNTKFGLRVIFCFAIHPMKKDETYMNSFLFNVMLILLASVSVTLFCAAAFSEYATYTDIELIFTVQIRYLVFFVYFYRYHVFEYSLLVYF